MRAGKPSNGPTTARRTTRGGQANVRFVVVGCSIATVSLIATSFARIAATVRCGRHSRQSRKRVVDATVVTCEQRDAETPPHACALPFRTCQPAAGAKPAGASLAEVVEAACATIESPLA